MTTEEEQKILDLERKQKLEDLDKNYYDNMADLTKKYIIEKYLIINNLIDRNIIYYPHKDKVCIGWFKPITPEEKIKYIQLFKYCPFKWYFKGDE
jgi:hypothetical protein